MRLSTNNKLPMWFAIASLAAGLANGQSDKPYTPAHTPDGQPDMQGMFTRNGIVGLERNPPENPIDPSDKNPF
jgi:hypothetical protein